MLLKDKQAPLNELNTEHFWKTTFIKQICDLATNKSLASFS